MDEEEVRQGDQEEEDFTFSADFPTLTLREQFLQRRSLFARIERHERRSLVRTRTDLQAMVNMQDHHMVVGHETVGEVSGLLVGDVFRYRAELRVLGVHRELERGIASTIYEGVRVASSVVFTGRYIDDARGGGGEIIHYAGEGGNHVSRSGRPLADQVCNERNQAMITAMNMNTPIRLVRGHGRVFFQGAIPATLQERVEGVRAGLFGPAEDRGVQATSSRSYSYDGIYRVVNYTHEQGQLGYRVYLFILQRDPGQAQLEVDLWTFLRTPQSRRQE